MEMDEDKIGLVLVRASELHSKIANSIHLNNKTHFHSHTHHHDDDGDDDGGGDEDGDFDGDYDDVDQDNDTLLSICDAFDSLESLLTSLQTLQQQQRYEREAVIGDIENSRKMLLKKLSDYNGEHIDVIREAEIFAGMKVEHDNDLLLPPYPTRTPHSLVLDNNNNLSRSLHAQKLTQNCYNGSNDLKDELKNDQTRTSSSKLWGGLRFLIHSTAKTMLTLVGVVALLNLTGFEPKINKKGANLNVLTLLQQPGTTRKKLIEQCPPGKVPVMEGGELRCIVKERVEIPFDSVAENPDVNYGCG